jgi:hypothetical protein
VKDAEKRPNVETILEKKILREAEEKKEINTLREENKKQKEEINNLKEEINKLKEGDKKQKEEIYSLKEEIKQLKEGDKKKEEEINKLKEGDKKQKEEINKLKEEIRKLKEETNQQKKSIVIISFLFSFLLFCFVIISCIVILNIFICDEFFFYFFLLIMFVCLFVCLSVYLFISVVSQNQNLPITFLPNPKQEGVIIERNTLTFTNYGIYTFFIDRELRNEIVKMYVYYLLCVFVCVYLLMLFYFIYLFILFREMKMIKHKSKSLLRNIPGMTLLFRVNI